MRFKIVRLTTICNGPKQTIYASGGLGLLPDVFVTYKPSRVNSQCETNPSNNFGHIFKILKI